MARTPDFYRGSSQFVAKGARPDINGDKLVHPRRPDSHTAKNKLDKPTAEISPITVEQVLGMSPKERARLDAKVQGAKRAERPLKKDRKNNGSIIPSLDAVAIHAQEEENLDDDNRDSELPVTVFEARRDLVEEVDQPELDYDPYWTEGSQKVAGKAVLNDLADGPSQQDVFEYIQTAKDKRQ